MHLRTLVTLSFACSSFAYGQSTSDSVPALEARLAIQDATLAQVREEIISVLAQPEVLNGAASLRQEEARSLKVRFHDIIVADAPTTQQLLAALRAEEQRLLGAKGDTLWLMRVAARAKTCAALRQVTQTAADLEQSPDWPLLSLKERAAVRTVVEEGRRQALADGDPCSPEERPAMNDSMLAK